MGSVLLMMVIEEDTPEQRAAAHETINKAKESYSGKAGIHACITTNIEFTRGINRYIRDNSVDVLVDDIADPIYYNLDQCPCAVAGVRGDISENEQDDGAIKAARNPFFSKSLFFIPAILLRVKALTFSVL